MIGSEALPRVTAAVTASPVDPATARARALVGPPDAAATATVTAVDGPFILPLVGGRRPQLPRGPARQVDASAPIGRYSVYLDAATGEPVAREQTLHFATGTVKFNVPTRGPQGARRLRRAASRSSSATSAVVTDAAGAVTFPDGMDAMSTGVTGDLVVRHQPGRRRGRARTSSSSPAASPCGTPPRTSRSTPSSPRTSTPTRSRSTSARSPPTSPTSTRSCPCASTSTTCATPSPTATRSTSSPPAAAARTPAASPTSSITSSATRCTAEHHPRRRRLRRRALRGHQRLPQRHDHQRLRPRPRLLRRRPRTAPCAR
jgi:hypothetical protein